MQNGERRFFLAAKVSDAFVNDLVVGLYGRMPIKLRLMAAMVEHMNDDGSVTFSINHLAKIMSGAIERGALYRARDELWQEDRIRKIGTKHYVNPRYVYKRSWGQKMFSADCANYDNLPEYGEDNEQVAVEKSEDHNSGELGADVGDIHGGGHE